MATALKKSITKYYYKDYLQWPEDERWELIDGIAYDMSPAPVRYHQDIVRELLMQFSLFLKNKKCKVYCAPFDVRLPKENQTEDEIDTVVQPDIAVICDKHKLDEKGCIGAPDLIIEILSPWTSNKDLTIKFNLYERVGVKEYWIVYPVEKIVMIFRLTPEQKYGRPETFSVGDKIKPKLFRGLTIDLSEVFTH